MQEGRMEDPGGGKHKERRERAVLITVQIAIFTVVSSCFSREL